MKNSVKIEQNILIGAGSAINSEQSYENAKMYSESEIQNFQSKRLDNKQNKKSSAYCERSQHIFRYEQLSKNSLDCDNSSLMSLEISESPTPPLRFCEVQRSIQVLKRAIPDVMDDTLLDTMYFSLLNNKNNCLRTYSQKSLVEDNKQKVTKSNQNLDKQKMNYRQDLKRNKIKIQQQTLQKGIGTFKQQSNSKSFEKKKNKQQKNKSENDKKLVHIWTEQMQNDFVQNYTKNNNINQIKSFFIKKYPQYEQYFTYTQLRSQGYKILRLALRKLCYLIANCQQVNLPQLSKISQWRSNFIFYFKQGAQVRSFLAELYKMEEFNYNFLSRLISSINNLFLFMEQDKVIMSKIGNGMKVKSKSKSSKNVFDHLQKDNNEDLYFEDDDKREQPVKYNLFQRK